MNCVKCGLSLAEDGDRNGVACECDTMSDKAPSGPAVVDLTIVTCNGCGRKREVYHDAPIVGAEALIDWMRNSVLVSIGCICGYPSCDMAHRLKADT